VVKLTVGSDDGRTLITRTAHAGEALGVSSVLTGHPLNLTAETTEPCQVKFIGADDFVRWLDGHCDAGRRVCVQLAAECETSNDHLRSLGLSHSAAEKLAHLILQWSDETGRETPEGLRVRMLMTHQEISQVIGTSRETVTRLLKDFREKNYLAIKGATLTIRDKRALQALVRL
jgi:CRP/FNR family transcriptional regulator